MSFKDILVQVDETYSGKDRAAAAAEFAKRHDAQLTGPGFRSGPPSASCANVLHCRGALGAGPHTPRLRLHTDKREKEPPMPDGRAGAWAGCVNA